MKLIGITGKKRSGKDTAANILVSVGYRKFSFASILKAMTYTCLIRLGLDLETVDRAIDGDLKEMPIPQLCGRTARHVMQTLGTEWGRKCIDPDFWVRACIGNATASPRAVISDVRFENEAKAIQCIGGKIIRILRDGCNGDGHASETMNFDVDYTIENNGTLEQLKEYLLEYERRN
jgi:hypothetical protein